MKKRIYNYTPSYYLSYWKKRGFNIEGLSEDELLKFIEEIYLGLNRWEKRAITTLLNMEGYHEKTVQLIKSSDIDTILRMYTEKVSISSKDWAKKVGKEALSKKARDAYPKALQSRIAKHKKEGVSDEEALYNSYLSGLETKGRRVAGELGLNAEVLDEGTLVSLSGYTKRLNYSKLSEEEKATSISSWKRSSLRNEKVACVIQMDFPEFHEGLEPQMTDAEVEYWFSQYKSLLAIKNLSSEILTENDQRGIFSQYTSPIFGKSFLCRSNLEQEFVKAVEILPGIADIKYEPCSIRYTTDVDRQRRYVPDYEIELQKFRFYVEVKPHSKIGDFMDKKGRYIDVPLVIITEYDLRLGRLSEIFKRIGTLEGPDFKVISGEQILGGYKRRS